MDYAADANSHGDYQWPWEDTDEKKQEYLRQEIIDKGYDAQHFTEFLDEKKPGLGPNVTNYTI